VPPAGTGRLGGGGWPTVTAGDLTGASGGPTSPSGHGGPCVRTTAPTATRGRTFRSSTHGHAHFVGARTAWPASVTGSSDCASRCRSGTVATPFSRSVPLG